MKQLCENYKNLFQNKNYIKILTANICNRFGDNIDAIALAWLVYEISNNPSLSAIYFAMNTLPTIIFQPLLGPFIEKHDLKKILVFSDILRGLCIFYLFVLLFIGKINAYAIIITTFFLSSFEAFRLPASSSLMVQILGTEQFESGISLNTSLSNVMEIIGMASAGLIIYLGGMKTAIFIDTTTFFVSAFLLSMIHGHYKNSSPSQVSYFKSLKNGFQYLSKQKPLLILSVLACFMNATLVPYNSFESIIVKTYYEKSVEVVSIIGIGITIFSMLGSFFFPHISKRLSPKQIIIFTFSSFSCFYAFILGAIHFHNNSFIFYGFMLLQSFILGIAVSLGNIQASILFAKYTDKNYFSRISAISNAMGRMITPLVAFLLSLVTNHISIPVIIFLFICLIFFFLFTFMKLNLFDSIQS